ncbi:alpha/beta hydrolase [uncultured Pseudodesulfovibrio sp.]|uniref:alpha/beta hydrolase family protein n=1 Tax=uncultured Pseudodesulfovibrio sp. TaxID=2035858 RepID=UPI0029C85ECE|nr:alpha/beta hydrolase [uncultured Pseudodesulfovibrio sp.]
MKRLTLIILLAGMLMVPWSGVHAGEDGKAFDAHATSFSYFFKDADMDFHFGNLVLGSAVNGGVEIGEAFYAASQIKDGDAVSWQTAWYELAKRVEVRGLEALKFGHTVSAREQLLRAAYYYRISLLAMLPDNPELEKRGLKCRSLMKQAGALFEPPLEYFEIPFEDTVLPGFFRKADSSAKPTKTLLMIGGGETYIEDLFFYIARQAHERGYNFMTVDLPGQGMLPHAGHVFRTDTNVPMKAVVDYALSRSDVDPKKLAAYGISGGGLFVPQAAMHDPRLKAVAMSSAVVDAYPLFAAMPAALASKDEIASWTSFHGNVVKSICWRYGVNQPSGLIEANLGNTFDASKIAAPALLIVGEGEYRSKEVQRQQKVALDNFPDSRSTMVVTPSDEGATNHCIMENRSVVGQVLFDWLDTIFK